MTTQATKPKRTHLLKEVFYKSLFCFFVVLITKSLPGDLLHFFENLNPLSNKIEDFQLSDLCFAYYHHQVLPDTNIFIFNRGNTDNYTMAEQLSLIERFKPRAIGIDLIFHSYVKERDLKLIDTINKYKGNIVLSASVDPGQSINTRDSPFYKTMIDSNDGNGAYNWGYLKAEEGNMTRRYFEPHLFIESDTFDAFNLSILKIGHDSSWRYLQRRDNDKELINYHRAFQDEPRYTIFDHFPADSNSVTGRIILFGSVDSSCNDDRYYTPLNKQFGRSLPDMDGVEYHAQILSMIINKDFIDQPRTVAKYTLLFIFIFLFMFFFNWLFRFHHFYHFISDTFCLFILFPASVALCSILLNRFRVMMEPTDYIIPIFFSAVFLHLYEPFVKALSYIRNKINFKKPANEPK